MCRNKVDGSRRCPCDTSEARRLRRHNAKAIAKYHVEKPEKISPKKYPTAPATSSVSMEQVLATVEDTNKIKTVLQTALENYTKLEDQRIELSDGSVIEIKDRQAYEYDAEGNLVGVTPNATAKLTEVAESYTVKTGATISALVDERVKGNINEIVAKENEAIDKAEARVKELNAELEANLEKRVEEFPPERAEDGRITRTSNQVFIEAVESEDPRALALRDSYGETLNKLRTAHKDLSNAAHLGSQEAREQMDKVRDETVKVLAEIRELGGELNVASNSDKKAVKVLEDAKQVYPKEWLEASNMSEPMRVKATSRRAHYSAGAYQNSYKVVEKKRMTLKPVGWTPDPQNRHEVGVWHKADKNGEWVDPETGMSYSHYNEPGKEAWVYTPVEWYNPWYKGDNYDPEAKPPGRGWVKTQVRETRYNYETRQHEDIGLQTGWYRPVKERQRVSTVKQPELTISGIKSGQTQAAKNVALHELAHRIEASPKVGRYITTMEEQFLTRRTTDKDTGVRESLVQIYPRSKEYGRKDDFTDLYMGKEYPTDHSGTRYREVLSTGAEAVFGTSFGNLAGLGRKKPDQDMRNFIIGLWASA